MNCPNCASAVPAGAASCARCGQRLSAGGNPTAEALILVGGIIGSILLFGFAGLLALLGFALSTFFEPLFGSGTPRDFLFVPLLFVGSVGAAMLLLAAVVAALGAGWTWATWRARRDLKEGNAARGSVMAMVSGGVLILVGASTFLPAVAGALVLVGGIMARRGPG